MCLFQGKKEESLGKLRDVSRAQYLEKRESHKLNELAMEMQDDQILFQVE